MAVHAYIFSKFLLSVCNNLPSTYSLREVYIRNSSKNTHSRQKYVPDTVSDSYENQRRSLDENGM